MHDHSKLSIIYKPKIPSHFILIRYTMADNSNAQTTATTLKVATVASYVLLVYGSIIYMLGLASEGKDPFDIHETPFSALPFLLFWFWVFLLVDQLTFIIQIFLPMMDGFLLRVAIFDLLGWHFVSFNILNFLWCWLFARGHYFWSELVVIVNFFNIIAAYIGHKTYAIRPVWLWLLIHVPVVAVPLSWLLYAIFWNGAVLFHVKHTAGRIIANVLIWDFLFVPMFYVLIYQDWAVGLSLSYLMLALGVGQVFTKLFGIQWVFAYIISALLFIGSTVVSLTGLPDVVGEESAPLLLEA